MIGSVIATLQTFHKRHPSARQGIFTKAPARALTWIAKDIVFKKVTFVIVALTFCG
jgi:hypothetical protein